MATNKQREHFENIHDRYQDHYYDSYSNYYREKIIDSKMVEYLAQANSVLEIGCGGASNYLRFAEQGFSFQTYDAIDISPPAVKDFNSATPENATGFVFDFTIPNVSTGKKYELILFLGVLHHMTNNLEYVFNNVKNALTRDGVVIFIEPNANFMNTIRNIWYRLSDDFDHTNERALTSNEIDLHATNAGLSLQKSKYFGHIGFFVILQSMVLRTPKAVKKCLTKPLVAWDRLIEKVNSKHVLAVMFRVYRSI